MEKVGIREQHSLFRHRILVPTSGKGSSQRQSRSRQPVAGARSQPTVLSPAAGGLTLWIVRGASRLVSSHRTICQMAVVSQVSSSWVCSRLASITRVSAPRRWTVSSNRVVSRPKAQSRWIWVPWVTRPCRQYAKQALNIQQFGSTTGTNLRSHSITDSITKFNHYDRRILPCFVRSADPDPPRSEPPSHA
jgi:hypothetical protein